MIRSVILVSAMLMLSGCELICDARLYPKVSTANDQMAKSKIDCDLNAPAQPGDFVAHARCINAAQDWILRPLLPYPDLLSRAQTARLTLSEQADRGEIDPGTLARLTPEDQMLTLDAATLDGPLSRRIGTAYYAPVPQRATPSCSLNYGFTDCQR